MPGQPPLGPSNLQSNDFSQMEALRGRSADLRDRFIRDGLFQPETVPGSIPGHGTADRLTWQISPEPFWITARDLKFIQDLGPRLLSFYTALNRLYLSSAHGSQPAWISRYLDQGKPEAVITYGRMKRFKHHLPGIIRPDLILTQDGWVATELDSVPGGIGLTGSLSYHYSDLGYAPVGGPDGMARGFAGMIRSVAGSNDPNLAIIVSEESKDYRPEMRWLGNRLASLGLNTFVIEPAQIRFSEEGLSVEESGKSVPIHAVYRFFELFDLKNIPKAELILYSTKKGKVALTPPTKTYLEEKLAFALFHHPALRSFWRKELGDETDEALTHLFPKSWVLDPQEVPPFAVIPDLRLRDRPVSNWRELGMITQKERRYILKLSGFSERAWGSRGVVVGHDLPEKEWAEAIDHALSRFTQSPSILQEFHQGRKVTVWQDGSGETQPNPMMGRVRLSPYYFVAGGEAELGGILATICPLDKKLIHGMSEAVMVPCAVKQEA